MESLIVFGLTMLFIFVIVAIAFISTMPDVHKAISKRLVRMIEGKE